MDLLPAHYAHQWDRIFTNEIDNPCTGDAATEKTRTDSSSVHSGPPSYNQRFISSSSSSSTLTTTYHVYHEGYQEHILISPVPKPPKKKNNNKAKANETFRQDLASTANDSYFVHRPYLSFHDPPRTLRRGPLKNGPPACLIQCTGFWRKWKLQFGDDLAKVIDPRGVVGWDRLNLEGGTNGCFRSCGRSDGAVSARDDTSDDDGRALKGYKVRSWRLWGESGKEYHREVNARRKSLSDEHKLAQQGAEPMIEEWSPYIPSSNTPYQASEVVYLTWMSPLSKDTRCYHFSFAGVDFFWKGTRDTTLTSDTKRPLRAFTRYNHLKLVGRIPAGSGFVVFHDTLGAEDESSSSGKKQSREDEVVLAHYTSMLKSRKYGVLLTYDDAIADFQQRFLHGSGQDSTGPFGEKEEEARCTEDGIRRTRFYEVLMATAMCMIIGEWEKRQVVKNLIASIIGAAAAA